MPAFTPDLDYIVDQIADAYVAVITALEADNMPLAVFWQDQLELMTAGLDHYLSQNRQ